MLGRLLGGIIVLTALAGCASVPNPLAGAAPATPAQAAAPAPSAPVVGASDPRVVSLVEEGTKPLTGAAAGAYMDTVEASLRGQFSGKGLSISRSGNQIVIDVPADMAFATGKSSLKPESRPTLVAIGAALKHFSQTVIDVYGYTDAQGAQTAQLDLSQRRAVTVATIMTSQGVRQERFYIEGKGAANPIASNATPQGRAQNRRIDIQISPII